MDMRMVVLRVIMREMIVRVIMMVYFCFFGFYLSFCLRVRLWWGFLFCLREEEEEGVLFWDWGIIVRDGWWWWVGIKLFVDGI